MFGTNYSKYDFGDRIAKRRKECGFRAQVDLAEKMVPPCQDADENARNVESKRKAISNWESGKTYPPLQDFALLCETLDCDPQYLLGDIDAPRKETQSVMDITGLSRKAIDKLMQIYRENRRSAHSDIISLLIENQNCEYFLALIGQSISYTMMNAKTPFISSMIEVDVDGTQLIARKENLIDSLIQSHILQDLPALANEYKGKHTRSPADCQNSYKEFISPVKQMLWEEKITESEYRDIETKWFQWKL